MKQEKTMEKPFLKAGYIGVCVIVMSVILLFIFPSNASHLPDGFVTPVVAFEFIRTPAEVFQLFAATDGTVQQPIVAAMNTGNYADYVYMVLYTAFLFLFSATCAKVSSNKFYYAGCLIAVAILFGDAMENVQLLGITAGLDTGGFAPYLSQLQVFTWIKWGGLAAVFLVLFSWFIRGNLLSKIVGLAGLASSVFGVLAYLHRSVLNEIFSGSVALTFVLMIVYCFTYKIHEAD